jgi:heme/copper-type cytochrome/quinol oxidase subunit 3
MADAQLALEAGPQKGRPRLLVIGTGLAVLAGSVFVGALLAVYAMMRDDSGGVTSAWVPRGTEFANAQLVYTVITAIASGLLLQWAVWANRRGDKVNTRIAIGFTLLFAAAELNMMLFAVDRLGPGIGESIWANLVYPITGVAIGLTVVGMIYLAIMAIKVFGGQIGARNPGLAAAAVFWYFQIAAWIAVFFTVFVVK